MFKSIKWKLEFLVVMVAVIVVLIMGVFLGLQTVYNYSQQFTVELQTVLQGELGAQLVQKAAAGETDMAAIQKLVVTALAQQGFAEGKQVFVLDPQGAVASSGTGDSALPHGITENLQAALQGKLGNGISWGSYTVDYAKPITNPDGTLWIVVYIFDESGGLQDSLNRLVHLVLQASAVGIVVAVLVGLGMARMITRPVRILTEKAKKIAEGNYEKEKRRVPRDELGILSQTLDQMAVELQSGLSEVEAEKDKLETIQRFMSDGVMAFDAQGKMIHINRAAAGMLNLPEEEPLQFDAFFHSIGIQISIAELTFKSETVLQRYYEKEGRHIEMLFARMSKGEQTTGVITMLHDVTQQQKLDAARREFVANVSHELRTPITTIKSYTETVMETEDLPRDVQKRFLGVVEKEADRMTRLIHDLLTLSSLDHDKSSSKVEQFDLSCLIAEVVDKLQLDTKRGQKLTYTQISSLPPFRANPDRIEQVLTNVISNALKYTPEDGTIHVFSGHVYDYIYVKVQDTGIGIAAKSLPHVFERFYRADRARSRNEGGTGLGLAIAKEIVEEYGGSISISSEVGKGTEVLMKFPIQNEKK